MKTVLKNSAEIAHSWAYSNDAKRCANASCLGVYFYSYSTIIAKKFEEKNVILLTRKSYSNTTSGQMNDLMSAIRNVWKPVYAYNCNPSGFSEHEDNIRREIASITELSGKRSRAKKNADLYSEQINQVKWNIRHYVHLFDLEEVFASVIDLIDGDEEILDKEFNAKIKEREDAEDKRKLSLAKKDLKAWLNGGEFKDSLRNLKPIFIRIKGDRLESTGSASIEIEKAKELYLLGKRGSNLLGQTMGQYTVVGNNKKTITIGCHELEWKQINKIAKKLNW